jgi:hypothetical protein
MCALMCDPSVVCHNRLCSSAPFGSTITATHAPNVESFQTPLDTICPIRFLERSTVMP